MNGLHSGTIFTAIWQNLMDFVPLTSGSKPQVKASYKRYRSTMNIASRGLLSVAVGYSGWADREMAGWKLPVGTAALRYVSDGELFFN